MLNNLKNRLKLLFYTGSLKAGDRLEDFLDAIKNSRDHNGGKSIWTLSRLTEYSIRPSLIAGWMKTDPERTRMIWALYRSDCKGYTPSKNQVEIGLSDRESQVRYVWAERMDFKPTFEQVERGLTDTDQFIRVKWAERMDFTPTPAQVERGLTDVDREVRNAWAFRDGYEPTYEQYMRCFGFLDDHIVGDKMSKRLCLSTVIPTPAQVESYLTYTSSSCCGILYRSNITISVDQVERALTSPDAEIRFACARRGFTPTSEQIERGLTDADIEVRKVWIEKAKQLNNSTLSLDNADYTSI